MRHGLLAYAAMTTFLLLSSSIEAENYEKCSLAPFGQLAYLHSQGFTVHQLNQREKDQVLLFEKQHYGPRPVGTLTATSENPWYAAYQAGAMLGGGSGRMGAIMIADVDKKCLLFSQELGGDLIFQILNANW